MEKKEKLHRIFFALWPGDQVRAEIKKHIQPYLGKHPAKKVPLHNWHITLAFLGNVSAETKQCAQEKAAAIHAQAFEIQLDKPGFFKRARVVWLGTNDCPQALTSLVDQLNRQLAACGYQTDFKVFIPHMTLLRKAYKGLAIEEFQPITWRVNEFVLVESVTTEKGATYEVINKWALN
jgi:2'-5' RNA ligase